MQDTHHTALYFAKQNIHIKVNTKSTKHNTSTQ